MKSWHGLKTSRCFCHTVTYLSWSYARSTNQQGPLLKFKMWWTLLEMTENQNINSPTRAICFNLKSRKTWYNSTFSEGLFSVIPPSIHARRNKWGDLKHSQCFWVIQEKKTKTWNFERSSFHTRKMQIFRTKQEIWNFRHSKRQLFGNP